METESHLGSHKSVIKRYMPHTPPALTQVACILVTLECTLTFSKFIIVFAAICHLRFKYPDTHADPCGSTALVLR